MVCRLPEEDNLSFEVDMELNVKILGSRQMDVQPVDMEALASYYFLVNNFEHSLDVDSCMSRQ